MYAEELIKYCFEYTASNEYWSVEEMLEEAITTGVIKSYSQKDYDMIGQRRWGFDSETVYLIDSFYYVSIGVYEVTSHEGDDPNELNSVVEVTPVDKIITEYVPVKK